MANLPSNDHLHNSSHAKPFFTKRRIITWAIIAIILTVAVIFALNVLWQNQATAARGVVEDFILQQQNK